MAGEDIRDDAGVEVSRSTVPLGQCAHICLSGLRSRIETR